MHVDMHMIKYASGSVWCDAEDGCQLRALGLFSMEIYMGCDSLHDLQKSESLHDQFHT